MNKQQQGFTIIELVMVIVVIGILAAFAIPRFANLGSNARQAKIEGAFASVRSASAIVHAAYLASGSTSAGGSITLDDGTIVELTNGYPSETGTTNGDIVEAAGINTNGTADYNIVAGTELDGQGGGAEAPTTIEASSAIDNCLVTYENAAANAAPTIAIDTSGC